MASKRLCSVLLALSLTSHYSLLAFFFLVHVAGDGMDGHDLPDPLLRHQAMRQNQPQETEDGQEPRNRGVGGEVPLGRGEGGGDTVEEERVRVLTVSN